MSDREPDIQRFYSISDWVRNITPPLTDDAQNLSAVGMGYVEHAVLGGKQAVPHVSFVKNSQVGVLATQFVNGDDKELFAETIRNLRQDCEVVVFATEAWLARINRTDLNSGNFEMPIKHPNRRECGIVQVYMKDRTMAFVSIINRNPNMMEPWEIMHDSAIEDDKLGGRFGE